MTDFPKQVVINEEGPREGFQIEPAKIDTGDKVRFIEMLADTGLKEIQCVSFVNPNRVPGMRDAESVAHSIQRRKDVEYTGIYLNHKGLLRAIDTPLDIKGSVKFSASEAFSIANTGKTNEESLGDQRRIIETCVESNIPIASGIVMTAFGCNVSGSVPLERVIEGVTSIQSLLAEYSLELPLLRLADTVGTANPNSIARTIGAIRDRWPNLELCLHLHDTRGIGMANAFIALSMGVRQFDSACGGLGGCPFAGHKGAAGNICTEDFAFMCEEMGVETGIDLAALVECARFAESIVGHPLPGKLMRGGTFSKWRTA